jgi:cation diffusion facilitator CzcD-associated flavoprotein CzcO
MTAHTAAPDSAGNGAARARRGPRTVIVGAGFGGIAAAIELLGHGFNDITILEKAPDLGGTWFYNSYPGAACDVPSHLYSFSYAQRTDWSRLCSPQAEILAYLHDVARRHHVQELIETGVTVTSCEWRDDERGSRWVVSRADGHEHEADVLILATGQLHQPARPAIAGAESFAGHSFHSAEWDHDYPLAGRRVAVVGTGASAVQFVPEIAPEAGRLTVFQRTGNWFLPRRNRAYPPLLRRAIESIPGLQAFRRRFMFEYTESLTLTIRNPRTFGRLLRARSVAFMRAQLRDPEVRRRAWPDYTFGCKRILFSSSFLPALQRPNVELVSERIERIEPRGLLTADGRLHEVDCIIWATGFRASDFMLPMRVAGRGGETLAERWSGGGAHAHLGMTVPGFPNMFMLYGPNTNTSGGSIIVYLEAQAGYIRAALQELARRGGGTMDVRAEVEAQSDRELQARFAGTAWLECDSWYHDEHGRIVTNWPGYMREYISRTRALDASQFSFTPPPGRRGPGVPVAQPATATHTGDGARTGDAAQAQAQAAAVQGSEQRT